MSFGDYAGDAALQAAWRRFCRQLEEAGEESFKDFNAPNALQRADAFRYLTQNVGQAFDLALETKHTKFPVIHAFCSPFCKLGGDAADFTYQQAWIDGEAEYKISGSRGTARFLNFAVQGPRLLSDPARGWRPLHEPFGDTPEANLFGHQLECNWDGGFELYIGGSRRERNWLPTTPVSRKLFIRQGFDRWDELPATLRIERIGMAEPRPIASPDEMMAAMEWAGNFVTGLMRDKPDLTYAQTEELDPDAINMFPKERRQLGNPGHNVASDRKRGRAASVMCWQLQPDEALIIEFDHHPDFWMMTNMGVYFTSMDYLYRPVSYTSSRTKVDRDGRVRLILAHDDPGYHNWIDTQGFERGHLANRNLLTDRLTEFSTKLVKRSELAAAMPVDSATISPEERARQLRERFHAILRRYCL
jgi:hypothetical protein